MKRRGREERSGKAGMGEEEKNRKKILLNKGKRRIKHMGRGKWRIKKKKERGKGV